MLEQHGNLGLVPINRDGNDFDADVDGASSALGGSPSDRRIFSGTMKVEDSEDENDAIATQGPPASPPPRWIDCPVSTKKVRR